MSAVPRLYVKSDLQPDGFAALDDSQAKYLTRVLRLGVGDTVRVFNGRDGEWRAVIDTIEGRSVLLRAEEELRGQATTPDVVLLFAPLKKARTDFVIEKATELGVCAIQPIITERTKASRVRADRLQKIALEAAEQTERLDLPVVHEAMPLMAALDALEPARRVFFCDESGDDPDQNWGGEGGRARGMLAALRDETAASGALLIGPEGGFSPGERGVLRKRENTVAVTLGPRILRAETAVVAALTLWESVLGDWRE